MPEDDRRSHQDVGPITATQVDDPGVLEGEPVGDRQDPEPRFLFARQDLERQLEVAQAAQQLLAVVRLPDGAGAQDVRVWQPRDLGVVAKS